MITSESKLEQYLSRRVRLTLGGLTFKLAPTVAGIPDRLVLLPGGRVLFVELKARTGKPSAIQIAMHTKMAILGVNVAVLYGSEDIDAWISAHDGRLAP